MLIYKHLSNYIKISAIFNLLIFRSNRNLFKTQASQTLIVRTFCCSSVLYCISYVYRYINSRGCTKVILKSRKYRPDSRPAAESVTKYETSSKHHPVYTVVYDLIISLQYDTPYQYMSCLMPRETAAFLRRYSNGIFEHLQFAY
jgi:hypothetical protein